MELIVFGFNFKTSSIEERERWRIPPAEIVEFLRNLVQQPFIRSAVYLSTCNRVEVYTVVDNEEALFSIKGFRKSSYVYKGSKAFEHLVRVACGLDSMVLGETEVLGQVKEAYAHAFKSGTTDSLMNFSFQQAFRFAKRIRTETGINRYPLSISSVAVMLVEEIFGNLSCVKGLVVGLGEMGSQAAEILAKKGLKELVLVNRTQTSPNILSLEALPKILTDVDLVMTSTSSEKPIISKEWVAQKKDGPLVLIDLGVPRDVDPAASALENVYLYNVDDLRAIAEKNLEFREKEARVAEKVIEKALGTFELEWQRRVENSIGKWRENFVATKFSGV